MRRTIIALVVVVLAVASVTLYRSEQAKNAAIKKEMAKIQKEMFEQDRIIAVLNRMQEIKIDLKTSGYDVSKITHAIDSVSKLVQ